MCTDYKNNNHKNAKNHRKYDRINFQRITELNCFTRVRFWSIKVTHYSWNSKMQIFNKNNFEWSVPILVRGTFIMNLFISWALDYRTDNGHDPVISYGPTVFLSLSNWFVTPYQMSIVRTIVHVRDLYERVYHQI